MNVLLKITYFLTSHIAIKIASTIKKIMQKWKIENHIIIIITNNNVNIIFTIYELKLIKRIFCIIYTL